MDVVTDTAGGLAHPSWRFPPCVPDGYVLRPRLHRLLAEQANARLILLSAPAGSGKSSLLAELIACRQAQGSACVWLSLGAGDVEPRHFLTRLLQALRLQLPGLSLAPSSATTPARFLDCLLAELGELRRPLLLVLDDWQPACVELLTAFNRFIRLAPAGLTLAIACEHRPALNLAVLRAKGQLLQIGLDDLCLTREEMRDLAPADANEEAVQALHALTEGWLPGVLLAGEPLTEALPPAEAASRCARELEGLLGPLFEGLAMETRELLLVLGVPARLSGELVGALTGRDDGQAVLEELEARQLFLVPLDRERRWYRFHRHFAGFLQSRLRREDAERFRQLHFETSLWFTNHHMQTLAIEHAGLAEDPEMLAALVGGYGLELINRGQLRRLHQWRRKIPDALVERHPILMLVDVWGQAVGLPLAEANRLLDELLSRWSVTDEAHLHEGRMAVLAIKAMLALQKDDLPLCVALVRKVEARLGQQGAFLEAATLLMGALAHAVLAQPEQACRLIALARQRNHFLEGRYLDMQLDNIEVFLAYEQGRLRQAAMLGERLLEQGQSFEPDGSALVLPQISVGLIAYRQGRFDGLEERLRAALAGVDVINPIDLYARGLLCLAQVQRQTGQVKESLATLMEVQNLAVRQQSGRFYALAVEEEILCLLQDTGPERIKRAEQRLKAVDWQRQAAGYAHLAFNPVRWAQGLSRVRLQQARGQFSEALHEITQLRALPQPGWHEVQRLRLDLLAALSYQHLGYHERGQSLLVQCLLSAEREGVRSLFLEEGDGVCRLLRQLEAVERQPALQGFLRELIGLWPGEGESGQGDGLSEALTERELEVIRLAAQGFSNDEIGRQLALALGTVKWHLHNIYEKFRVRNRTQAIRRARDLGVLA